MIVCQSLTSFKSNNDLETILGSAVQGVNVAEKAPAMLSGTKSIAKVRGMEKPSMGVSTCVDPSIFVNEMWRQVEYSRVPD